MRVSIISAYPAVRAGLAALVHEQPEWQVVSQLTPQAAARSPLPQNDQSELNARTIAPLQDALDVILADLDGVNDTEVLEAWLPTLHPRGGIVVIAPSYVASPRGRADPAALALVNDALRAAEASEVAFGALRRDATTQEIIAAVSAVAGGLITLDRQIASELLNTTAQLTPAMGSSATTTATGDESLTARELEVLQLLAQGLPNKLIAQRLHISEHTAKFHVSAIMMKLGAASRTEAVTRAARRGLLLF